MQDNKMDEAEVEEGRKGVSKETQKNVKHVTTKTFIIT